MWDKEKQRAYSKQWWEKNRERILPQRRLQHQTEQYRLYEREYRASHRKQIILTYRKTQCELKTEVLTHYGNGKLACVRCGFNDIRALSIDHIKGGGINHRQGKKRLTGLGLWSWLRRNNYPEGFQTLCMNCQFIKRDENNELKRELF